MELDHDDLNIVVMTITARFVRDLALKSGPEGRFR